MARINPILVICAMLFVFIANLQAEDKPARQSGTASGLLVDFKDDNVTVQIDGEDEPTKYLLGAGVTKQDMTKHNIFPVDRVNLKFKVDGDDKKLVAIEKVPGKANGIVIGKVLKVYNDFWVAVKPSNGGMIEGFALNWPPEKFKQSHDLIKTLKSGDTVAIKYATDFERHRILQMEVKSEEKK